MTKIGIIGGGISGLYLANKLKNVTIFEGNKFGGDIQGINYRNKCYPVSTLFAMPNDNILKKEFDSYNIKSKSVSTSPLAISGPVSALFIFLVYKFIKELSVSYFILLLLLTIVSIILIFSIVCFYTLSFGANNKCSSTFDKFTLKDIFSSNSLRLPYDCGFVKLVDYYSNNNNVNYVNKKVVSVNTTNLTITTNDGKTYTFDKIIIATNYKCYSKFLDLKYLKSKQLKSVEYFDFYSTFVDFYSEFESPEGSLGYQQLDDCYLFASHKPLEFKNAKFIKVYKWSMPQGKNKDYKNLHNDLHNDNIYFVGKELAGNGVNQCLLYANNLIETCFS